MRAAIALGSNLGDRLENLRAARNAIVHLPGVTPPVLASAMYETEAVDCEPGAGEFLNAVIEFGYNGSATELLQTLLELEASLGRPPNHRRNVSRQLDIDLLYINDIRLVEGDLQLPHPRMHLRRFVLEPLADIRPELVLSGQAKSIGQLLASVDRSAKVIRLTTDWNS